MASTTVNLNTMLTLQYRMNKNLQQMDGQIKRVNASLWQMDDQVNRVNISLEQMDEQVKKVNTSLERLSLIAINPTVTQHDQTGEQHLSKSTTSQNIPNAAAEAGETKTGWQKFGEGVQKVLHSSLSSLGTVGLIGSTAEWTSKKITKRRNTGTAAEANTAKATPEYGIPRAVIRNDAGEIVRTEKTATRIFEDGGTLKKLSTFGKGMMEKATGAEGNVSKSGASTVESGKTVKMLSALGKAGRVAGKIAKPLGIVTGVADFIMAEDKVKAGSELAGSIIGMAVGSLGGPLGAIAGYEAGKFLSGKAVGWVRNRNANTEKVKGDGQPSADFAGDALGPRPSGKYLSNPPLYQQQPVLPPIKGGSNILPFGPLPAGVGANRIQAPINQQLYFNMTINSQADANQVADEAAQKIAWEVGKVVQNRAMAAS